MAVRLLRVGSCAATAVGLCVIYKERDRLSKSVFPLTTNTASLMPSLVAQDLHKAEKFGLNLADVDQVG